MKKLLLTCSIFSLGMFAASAQCTPNPNLTSGIDPDTASNLPISYTGQSYDEVITFKVPQDTNFNGSQITILFVRLDEITGLPANYTYNCTPTSCDFPGGQSSCVRLYSTSNPTVSQIGAYQLDITASPYISLFGTPVSAGSSSYDGYVLVIADGATSNVERINAETFKTLMAIPNPTNGNTRIQFAMGYASDVTFTVTNLLGKVVTTQKLAGNRGVNEVNFDATNVPNGVYLYTITDGKNVISKKLVVNK
jgi:hypothetical protein